MVKRFAWFAVALAAFSSTVQAQERDSYTSTQLRLTGATNAGPALALYRPDIFSSIDGTTLMHGLPVLTLLDGRRFPISSELGRMGMAPLDVVPLGFLNAVEVQKSHGSPMAGSDWNGGVVDLRLQRDWGTHGEIGMFYGKSSGRYGREDFQAYIVGGVGNDHIQVNAGASYEESSVRYARPRR